MKSDNSLLPKPLPPLPSNYDLRREAWLVAYAETSCKMVQALTSHVIEGAVREGTFEYSAIVTAIYVIYARPFCRCGGVGLLEESDIPTELLEMHRHMLTYRHKVYGHKDSEGIILDDNFTANEVRAVVDKLGRMLVFCTDFYTRPPKMDAIRTHVIQVQQHTSARMKQLHAQLMPNGKFANGDYMFDGEFLLNLNWQEDLPFKRIPIDASYVYKEQSTDKPSE